MARPTIKSELLDQSQSYFKILNDFINALSEEKENKEFPQEMLNRNIRDVLAHLHEWHNMFKYWYSEGMKGNTPYIPAKGYTWKTVPELNKKINSDYSSTSLEHIKDSFYKSHQEIQKIIESHTNEELFDKKRYTWTGTTSLGAYLISATSSHYNWGLKLIKKALK